MKFNLKSVALISAMLINGLAFASTPQSVSVIKFGDANTLFVGDSKSTILYAYSIGATTNFITLNQVDYIMAAYTCTPLVLIPVKDIKDGAHIVGKTIAEMGYGNTPVDIIRFQSEGMDKKPYDGFILANKNRTAQFINVSDLEASEKASGIGYVGMGLEKGGAPFVNLPMTGLLQLDDQDGYHIVALRRNDDNGTLELISFLKNMYLRLDEFVSEYDQPTYKYEGQQMQMKGYQNMMIQDLGLTQYLKP